jgi:hypothetical protein
MRTRQPRTAVNLPLLFIALIQLLLIGLKYVGGENISWWVIILTPLWLPFFVLSVTALVVSIWLLCSYLFMRISE